MCATVYASKSISKGSLWQELYQCCWDFYVKNSWDSEAFKSLVARIISGEDNDLISFLVWFNDARKLCDFNDRFAWLTSFHLGRRYVPIDSQLRFREPWNNVKELDMKTRFGQEAIELVSAYLTPRSIENSIIQHADINNCALICSLINAKRFNLLNCSETGELFNLNFHFNGASRLVSVLKDSRFPRLVATGSVLTLSSLDVWDKLIELAYFEVKNDRDYCYAGSNTAADTYLLTGWIPEVFELHSLPVDQLQRFFDDGCLLAAGTSIGGDNAISYHDFVITGVDKHRDSFLVVNPHVNGLPSKYTWDGMQEEFKWIYINWDPAKRYSIHKRAHERYMDKYNKYSTWTQKPIMEVCNESGVNQECILFMERHLLKDHSRDHNLTVGDLPSSGFTAVTATGSNTGFQKVEVRLTPGQSRKLFYHSDVRCNLTFHLFTNNDQVSLRKSSSDITTLESSWNVTNNKWSIGSVMYFRNPAFKLKLLGSEDVYLDFEIVSQLAAKVNLLVFQLDDYLFQRPLSRDSDYRPQVFSQHSIRLIQGLEYCIVCSTSEPVETAFVLSVRCPQANCRFELSRYSLGFGGLRYNYSLDVCTKNVIKCTKFTAIFIMLYLETENDVKTLAVKLYDRESEHLLFDQVSNGYSMSNKPFVIPTTQLRPGTYILEIQSNPPLDIKANIGTSHSVLVTSI